MLTRLVARGFRNLEPLTFEPGPGSHLLLGDNGAGKTSLLEAIYVLATTKSFRTPQLTDCHAHGGEGFYLEGEVASPLRATLRLASSAEGRVRSVNGKATPLAEHLAVLPLVVWSAADSELLTGPPAGRRRLVDRGVLGVRPAALEDFGRYRQALAQKRQLLATGGRGLTPWNAVLAEAASRLIELRADFVSRLGAEIAAALAASGLPFPPIELVYRPSPARGLEGAATVLEALERASSGERRRKMPLVGPHRDDLEVRWGSAGIKRTASAGEKKALSLLVVAAHGRVLESAGRKPLYLLDDLDAELARRALERVYRVLGGAPQLFVSSNRPEVFEGLEITARWGLERGALRPLQSLADRPVNR